jgi:hypothetical protein
VIEDSISRSNGRGWVRVVHYSIQSNHVHLLGEVRGRERLALGMNGLLVRCAKGLNRLWERRGSVFDDRYHAHSLSHPSETRSALLYVLKNHVHHGSRGGPVDPYSSALAFEGWREPMPDSPRARWVRSVVARPRSWLLTTGWRRGGAIGIDESPVRAASGSASESHPD